MPLRYVGLRDHNGTTETETEIGFVLAKLVALWTIWKNYFEVMIPVVTSGVQDDISTQGTFRMQVS